MSPVNKKLRLHNGHLWLLKPLNQKIGKRELNWISFFSNFNGCCKEKKEDICLRNTYPHTLFFNTIVMGKISQYRTSVSDEYSMS